MAFEIPSELRRRAEAVIDGIREEPDKDRHVPDLIAVILEMTDTGLQFYFLHPLKQAGVGLMTRSAVELAIGTAGRALPMVVRKTVNSLSDEQLLSIVDFMERILIRDRS